MKVFLSYHTPDQATARSMAELLRARDPELDVFFAPWALRPGAFWIAELATAIEDAEALILLLGKQSPGPWQLLELILFTRDWRHCVCEF